ncbi:hypothetical protein Bpfe_015151 [Biomphalaria pfeifferi]|uniref:Uncharacterized protein n=1 Tax=Biomphalaria pfeifferi TaxID=112525 RepID=A0AAD8BIV1_BIOPF|nr:hypothetical protein Bpfe_015151 [Biomphalaria pfeifferi]
MRTLDAFCSHIVLSHLLTTFILALEKKFQGWTNGRSLGHRTADSDVALAKAKSGSEHDPVLRSFDRPTGVGRRQDRPLCLSRKSDIIVSYDSALAWHSLD